MTEDEARARVEPGEWLAGRCRCCGEWLVGRPNEHPLLADVCSDCLTCDRSTGLPCQWSPEGEALSCAARERALGLAPFIPHEHEPGEWHTHRTSGPHHHAYGGER